MQNNSSEKNPPFIPFNASPKSTLVVGNHCIANFEISDNNIDFATVEAFGDEWTKFNHFSDSEIDTIANAHYFDIAPLQLLKNKSVLDVGCGTGRWTKFVAKHANTVDAVDPSKAIEAAAKLLAECSNIRLSRAAVDNLPFADNCFDFVFSLGVLHHIPDTDMAIKKCVEKLKTGGHFLVYLYYNLDNRGLIFKSIFRLSNHIRRFIANQPAGIKNPLCDAIALFVYYPFILTGTLIKKAGLPKVAEKIPLHFYVGKTYNVIKNDARDRFGTPLEQRFTKNEIKEMMVNAGLTNIVFSNNEPYWHAIGQKI